MRFSLHSVRIGFVLSLFAACLSAMASSPDTGVIAGRVLDSETGDPLPGANVIIRGTQRGAATDLNGSFRITSLAPGVYSVTASMIGYTRMIVEEVNVDAGKVTRVDFVLHPEALVGEEVVIEAKALRDSDGALLKARQKASTVSDAISSESISRSGSSDAADAMRFVTGASVVEGKYVYIRGLGERYTTTQLNGAELPSIDPYKKTVQMDLFPSILFENIVATKTFTPDKPGNYTGGSINMNTKNYPERFTLSFTTSAAYNSQTTGSRVLTYRGGNRDWLGFDDGTRAIPPELADPNVEIPTISTAFRDREAALKLDALSRAFNPTMAPGIRSAPFNYRYSFSLGNQTTLFGRSLGFLASLTYHRQLLAYDNGVTAQYQLTGKVAEVDELNVLSNFRDSRSADEVRWGGMGRLSYKLHRYHSLGGRIIYTRSGESVARYQSGPMPRDLPPGTTFETRVLQYVEREMRVAQIDGSHYLPGLADSRIKWMLSHTNSSQEEPDLRFFSNEFIPFNRNGVHDTLYAISVANYSRPARYFRTLDEQLTDYRIDLTFPLQGLFGIRGEMKFGSQYSGKSRSFRERRFEYYQTSAVRYDGDPQAYFGDQAVGIVDSSNKRYRFGNYIVDASQLASNYDGDESITAFYTMVDLPISQKWRLITGARFEKTRTDVQSLDPAKPRGKLVLDDLLPSVNLIYRLSGQMNLRAAYGRTLARPNLRELAPFPSFDFIGDFIFVGNPELKRTLIDNFDLRWEWFMKPGEVLAVSGFYKHFKNPIERAIVSDNNQGQFQNVDAARVYGVEFEARMRLGFLHTRLDNLIFGSNLTFVHSRVDIPGFEMQTLRALDPNASDTRPLQGQSPFVLNLNFSYDNLNTGTSIGMYYNLFGDRLSEVSLGGTPNVFEKARGSLDATFSQKIWHGISVKLSAKNLLDSYVRKVYPYKGKEFVATEYPNGRTFGLSIRYEIQ